MSETLKHVGYVAAALDGFRRDPPDSDYQRGYLAALLVVWREGFGQHLTAEETAEFDRMLVA